MFQGEEVITNQTIGALINRKSVREFTDRKLSNDDLEVIVRPEQDESAVTYDAGEGS